MNKMFAIVNGRIKMSPATIQTSREFGLEYLYPVGCNTNCFTVAHARDILSFMNERISFSLTLL